MKNNFIFIFLIFIFSSCNKSAPINKQNVNTETIGETQENNDSGSGSGSTSGSGSGSGHQNLGDPLQVFQWHLDNTGQPAFANRGGTSGEDINFNPQNSHRGAGVLVAVSDNAVQVGHEDLSFNALAGTHKNYFNSYPYSGDPSPSGDDSAHGTAVAGIILATADNGKGGIGVASSASLAGFKFIGASITTSKLVDQANGSYDVFNYSWGGYSCSFSTMPSSYIAQLEYGVSSLRSGRGAIYVKAAGNEYYAPMEDCYDNLDGSPYYLGNAALEEDQSYPYFILVGALDANGISAFYSSPGSSLWISAPGGDFGINDPAIVTTDIEGCSKGYSKSTASENDFESGELLNSNCNYTSTMNGTSSASPIVAGVIASMLSANPALSWRDVKHILAATARKVHASSSDMSHPLAKNLPGHTYMKGWQTNGAGFHFHNWYGFGGVQADDAINMAANYVSSWGPQELINYSSGNITRTIPDDSSVGASHTLTISEDKKIEAFQIKVNIEHPNIGDLGIEVTSPSGMKSQFMLINSGLIQEDIDNAVLLSNAFYMESSQGSWTIKVIDGEEEDVGELINWSIKVWAH